MNAEEFEKYKYDIEKEVKSIIIPIDVTPGIIKGILARIDRLFSYVRIEYAKVDAQREKFDSIVREWERTKISGSNELERKKNASEELQHYPDGVGGEFNMYQAQRDVYERYIFLSGVLDILNAKQSRLITLSGIMKLESNVSGYNNE